jgi:hypothetical protein
MTILNYIDPFWFIMALGVGLLYTYVTAPPPEIIIKYPTPFNQHETTYTDKAGVCYKYNVKLSSCPQDENKVRARTLQIAEPVIPLPVPTGPSWTEQLLAAFKGTKAA